METSEKEAKVVLFNLGNETYGVPIKQVRSIERLEPITRVPNAAAFVEGVMNLRGVVIPIVNVRKRLGFDDVALTKNTRIVVVTCDTLTAGLLVDAVKEVVAIDPDRLEKTPDIVGGPSAAFIGGVVRTGDDGLLILLNMEKVLNDRDVDGLKQIGE